MLIAAARCELTTTRTGAPARPIVTVPIAPGADRRPVESAVAESIAAQHGPETFLWIVIPQPDGGARIRYAWTDGGAPLGDHIDQLALAAGLDAADWLHLGDRNCRPSTRGRIRTEAYALRPILADIHNGVRSPEPRRDAIRRVIDCAARTTGQTARPGVPRWLGVGPALLARTTP